MKVVIKRIDKSLPLPKYETEGSVAFDLITRLDTEILPGQIGLIPANVIIKTPPNYMLMLASRSSTPLKRGLSIPHGVGIIDQDYCGPTDELKIQVYNFTNEAITIKRGDKIAQGTFVRIDRFDFDEVDDVSNVNRGGFGSTGL